MPDQHEEMDPETPAFAPILYQMIMAQVLYLFGRYASIFVLLAHIERYRRTKHLVSLLAVIGSSISLLLLLSSLVLVTADGACDLVFFVGLRFVASQLSSSFMFFHLLFKARLVYLPTGRFKWTPLQITSGLSATFPPILAVILMITSTLEVADVPTLATDTTPDCRVAFVFELSITLSVTLVINNILTASLFLGGIVESLVLPLDPLPFSARAQALLWIVLLGSDGLRDLQKKHWKNEPGRFVAIQSRDHSSRSSSNFDPDTQHTLILLVRRVFIVMTASAIASTALYTLSHLYIGLIWVMLYHSEPIVSWVFTVIASPLPHEHDQARTRSGSNSSKWFNFSRSSTNTPVDVENKFAESTELSDLSKLASGSGGNRESRNR